MEFAALCFIRPIVSIGCESQEPERQHGRSKRQRICVVTESQQVIIEQEAVCNWPVFGAVCCAEAGAERYWWQFLHHIRRCFFALEPRLLPRASALITGKEPPPWTLRSVFVCVYERAGCGVSCFSGAQSPPILSPCLSSFNTSTTSSYTPLSRWSFGEFALAWKRRANIARNRKTSDSMSEYWALPTESIIKWHFLV